MNKALTYFYSYFYNKNIKSQDEIVSWFYAQSVVGFIFSLSFMAIFHLFFILLNIPMNPFYYLGMWILPWLIHLILFYKRKNSITIVRTIPKKWVRYFWITFLTAKAAYWATLILYAFSQIA